jgi:hypothetical protein
MRVAKLILRKELKALADNYFKKERGQILFDFRSDIQGFKSVP